MKRLLVGLLLLALTVQPALAIPGQTEKQLNGWGKAHTAFHNFKSAMDQNTGGTVYTATFNVDGKTATFSSEPLGSVVHHEFVGIVDSQAGYSFATHLDFTKDAIAVVYGSAVANDFVHAKDVTTNHLMIRKGASFGYSVTGEGVVIFRLADLAEVLKNARECASFDCAGD